MESCLHRERALYVVLHGFLRGLRDNIMEEKPITEGDRELALRLEPYIPRLERAVGGRVCDEGLVDALTGIIRETSLWGKFNIYLGLSEEELERAIIHLRRAPPTRPDEEEGERESLMLLANEVYSRLRASL